MLAGVLVLCCRAARPRVLVRGDERYARVGSGAPRLSRRRLGRATICLLLAVVTAALALGVPFVTIGALACRRRRRCLEASTRSAWRLARRCSLALAGACWPRSPPCRWPGFRCARRGLQRLLEAATTMSARCPASWLRWHWSPSPCASPAALPDVRTILPRLCMLMFLPRALLGLRPVSRRRRSSSNAPPWRSAGTPLQALWSTTMRLAAPGCRGRHGAGGARHHERTDRDPDAGAQRHPHAGDGILVADQRD
jgi:iron(III) transport system permease protein